MTRVSWKNPTTGERAQFVADILNESLFDYSFDSNRVPSLSLNYFCYDYIQTYSLVEDGIMDKGNMIPLIEEFEYILKNSVWLPCGISSAMLNFKNKNGIFMDVSQDKSLNPLARSKYYLENAKCIRGLLTANKNYYLLLLEEIEHLLRSKTYDFEDKKKLYFCIRELLSELINRGVNKTYLYRQVQEKLFSDVNSNDDINYILSFLKSLDLRVSEYKTIFGVTDEVYSELKDVLKVLREATEEETTNLSTKYVVDNKIQAPDSVSALRLSKSFFSSILSVYNACKHDKNIKVIPKGMVRKMSEKQFQVINELKEPLGKNQNNKNFQERKRWLYAAIKGPISGSLFSAFELHNTALEIEDSQTQLLNIWTIFELLIDSKQESMSRINYISNILCSILCNYYYKRRLESLFEQISKIDAVIKIVDQEQRGKDSVQNFGIILKDNVDLQQKIKSLLNDCPLATYKMEELSLLFTSKEALKDDLKRHSDRLRWQIMRIYRNRCMIVHNGQSFSQLDSVLENEHYYVDELFDYILGKRDKGIVDTEAIFALSRIKEKEHLQLLSDKTNKNSSFSDEDFLSVIFDY
ncbi:hypothetical protein J6W78_00070 [bacterium]|nr:hypothetical protein [bacterium]